ncbi:hypothetical protein LCI18_003741 [Fusarium solani-melongenae]|uniref:Uncharacterized protein n=1 Tax=Fusarium solani subsp. cucurbitae TaxID=2747967 RepID=A0ACD3YV90_FUSSC|nr:hypothetical protein LCI18_003741 [Fusarium solani-melongenae]
MREPFLCCTILTISSRYRNLDGKWQRLPNHPLHYRLWDHCLRFITMLVTGQENTHGAKFRTLGAVGALLLRLEWHPLPLFAPLVDSEPWVTPTVFRDSKKSEGVEAPEQKHDQWVIDMNNKVQQSDRASCMILGCAMTLDDELGILDIASSAARQNQGDGEGDARLDMRRISVVKLLYTRIPFRIS